MDDPDRDFPTFELAVAKSEDGAVASAIGELDLAAVDAFLAPMRELLAAGPVVLDLEPLTFLDSSGVRALDAIAREAERDGASLVIRPVMRANVRQVLDLTGMIRVLPMADS